MRAELCVRGIPGHPAFDQDHVVATDLVLQAYLMLCMLRDPLLTPAMDAAEVDMGEINGHPARLSATPVRWRDVTAPRPLAVN